MSNIHPLEVVCRGSETQLQVGKNKKKTASKTTTTVVVSTLNTRALSYSILIFSHLTLCLDTQLQVTENVCDYL